MYIVSGTYIIRPGKRDEFMEKLYEQGIIAKIRREEGNVAYHYYYPYENADSIYFVEQWESRPAWEAHCTAPHVTGDLKALKDTYMIGFEPGLLGSLG